MKKNKTRQDTDLTDNRHDQQRLQGDQAELELPDLQDIPGQEYQPDSKLAIIPDSTASSDDEEGTTLWGTRGNHATKEDINSSVSREERTLLNRAYHDQEEDSLYEDLSLESQDDDGESVNEKSLNQDHFGEDLDSELTEEEDEEDK
jgi:hypothetical protein